MEDWEKAYNRQKDSKIRNIKNNAIVGSRSLKEKISGILTGAKNKFKEMRDNRNAKKQIRDNVKDNRENIGKVIEHRNALQERLDEVNKPYNEKIDEYENNIGELEYQIETQDLTKGQEAYKKRKITENRKKIEEIKNRIKTAQEEALEQSIEQCNEVCRKMAKGEIIANLDEVLESIQKTQIIPIISVPKQQTEPQPIFRPLRTKQEPEQEQEPESMSTPETQIQPQPEPQPTQVQPQPTQPEQTENTQPMPNLPIDPERTSGLQIYNRILQNIGYIKGTKAITAHDWLNKFGLIGKGVAAIIRKATGRKAETERIIEELDNLEPEEFNLLMEEFLIKDNDSINTIKFKVNEIFLEAVEKKCQRDYATYAPSIKQFVQTLDIQINDVEREIENAKNPLEEIKLIEKKRALEQSRTDALERQQQLERRPRAVTKAREDKSLDKKNNIKGKTRAVRNPDNREEVQEAARIERSMLDNQYKADTLKVTIESYNKEIQNIEKEIMEEDAIYSKAKHITEEQQKGWAKRKAELQTKLQDTKKDRVTAIAKRTQALDDALSSKQDFEAYLGENTSYEFSKNGKIKRSVGQFEAPKGEITVISNQRYVAPEVLHAAGLATAVAATQAAMIIGQQHQGQDASYEFTNEKVSELKAQITDQKTIDAANNSINVDAYNVHAYGERAANLGSSFNMNGTDYGMLDEEGVNRANEAFSQIHTDSNSSLSEILTNKAQIAREGGQEGLNRVSELANDYYNAHNAVSGAGVDHEFLSTLESNMSSYSSSQADLYEAMANLARQVENLDATQVEIISKETGIDLTPVLLTFVPSAVRTTKDVIENSAKKRRETDLEKDEDNGSQLENDDNEENAKSEDEEER